MPELRRMSEVMRLRATVSSYAVWAALFAVPLAIAVAAAARNHEGMWFVAVICAGGIVGSWAWLGGFDLTLSADGVRYKAFMRRSVTLHSTEISRVSLHATRRTYRDKFRPTLRLVIEAKEGTGRPDIVLNAKVFGAQELRTFVQALEDRIRQDQA